MVTEIDGDVCEKRRTLISQNLIVMDSSVGDHEMIKCEICETNMYKHTKLME